MVLATRTSAPNTSLAVIRPKPRPVSPTASEISVIMLKSELPHEAPNPVSKKTSGFHHSSRRRSGAIRPLAAAAARADSRCRAARRPVEPPDRDHRRDPAAFGGIDGGPQRVGLDRRPQYPPR